MKDGTAKYVETITYLSELYNFLNDSLFSGELVRPVITVQRDEKNKTNGWFSVRKVWKWQEKQVVGCSPECGTYDSLDCEDCLHETTEFFEDYELNMTAQQLNRPIADITATLIHEMCHQYALAHNIQDTSRGGGYHNKLFKMIAEKHGLLVDSVPTIGWSHTTLKKETLELLNSYLVDHPDNLICRVPVMKGQTVKTSSTRKYVCPCCGDSVRATKEVKILCIECNMPMVQE